MFKDMVGEHHVLPFLYYLALWHCQPALGSLWCDLKGGDHNKMVRSLVGYTQKHPL